MILTAIGAGLGEPLPGRHRRCLARGSGLAAGIVNTSQQLGAALGLAALSSIAAARRSDIRHHGAGASTSDLPAHALVEGFLRGFVIGAVILAVGAFVALLGVPRPEQKEGVAASDADVALVRAQEAEIGGGLL